MKIFEMNEMDWVAAPNAAEACTFYNDMSGLEDCSVADIRELTDAELDTLQFHELSDDNQPTAMRTFRQQLAKMVAEGDDFPCVFASTEI